MKTLITLFIISSIGFISFQQGVKSQCVTPGLKFANPVLVSGDPLSEGAIYKFPNITAGIDCYIKLAKFNGGATLISMETPGQGYPDAWQPIINGPGTPTGNKSWIDWEISFKTTAGTNYAFTCLDISAIDVDGDNSTIGEFIESDGHVNYNIPSPTFLTVTDMGSGRIEAQAQIINRPSIDTSAMDVRIGFLYNGKDNIQLKLGSTVLGAPGGATQRLNCIYFKKIVMSNYYVLPVKFISLHATANGRKINLNWLTDKEVNNSHFEVERSFDGINFSVAGMVLDGFDVDGNYKSYGMRDNIAASEDRLTVYYRVKQVDVKGAVSYSSTAKVRLASNGIKMQVSPNPFAEKLLLHITSETNGTAILKVQNITGQTITTKNVMLSKGSNRVQIDGLGELLKGVYIAQVVVDGAIIINQKIIKD